MRRLVLQVAFANCSVFRLNQRIDGVFDVLLGLENCMGFCLDEDLLYMVVTQMYVKVRSPARALLRCCFCLGSEDVFGRS